MFQRLSPQALLGAVIAQVVLGLLLTMPALAADPGNLGATNNCPADRPCISGSRAYGPGHHIQVNWNGNGDYDGYNVRWWREGQTSHQAQVGGGFAGAFTLDDVELHTRYYFIVEGCVTHFLSSSTCSPWTEPAMVSTYDPDDCLDGYVWREASPTDRVCVAPATRNQAAYDNRQASARADITRPHVTAHDVYYYTCRAGYVWREAFAYDYVCVTPATRAQAAYDNSQRDARRHGGRYINW